ncbi:putative tetrahydrocannabinolic acid synthase-like [Capsicum annuum]|nr:putative tetrahydrocannabinolic acid synthase-like [Capsicum annuum]KAF3623070.1 putative tetrahydrocannabinolic acid synthase-like [Capsicum annuum]
MGVKIREFNVNVIKTDHVVAAMLPMQEHCRRLPQSNLDLLLPPIDVGVFFCYQNPNTSGILPTFWSFSSMVKVLKVSLAETLVAYYPFAGELVQNLAGEPEILCNNAGVDFIEAWADVELKEINFYNPDESIEGKLVPKKKHGVLAVQVTELKCGGVVVACTFDHRVADAYSANMFLASWAELAQSKPLSQPPSFQRSFLFPRRPSYQDPLIDSMYLPISALKQETTIIDHDDHVISRIYYVKAEEIKCLQSLANCNNTKFTKLETFSAFLWKTIANGMEKSQRNNHKNFKLGIVVNGRSRLSSGDEDKVKLLKGYFGNVISIPFGEKKVKELKEKSLSWVASVVHEFLENAVTKEHFLGLINWVEKHRPEPALARIYATNEDSPAVVVSSGQRFPVREIEFGWGEAVFGSYHFPWDGKSGYVMPMPSPKGNGDWIVYMHMLKGQVDLVEADASNVFKPLTAEYLNLK